jgi:cation diffusion facilitator CzcD-associated flavoprotein CzcO
VDRFDVVVVGAGFAGMYAIHRFERLGLSVRCFEAAGDVGGTWWWNRYPGARCDIESLDYSYSFSPELEQEWDWTERYATQPEVLRYADHVADRFRLRRHIEFDTRIVGARWDERSSGWRVTTEGGESVKARFLVLATGVLSAPKLPEVAGLGTFAGTTFHTARWPHHDVDFAGQRVAVIGTGSSGIQAIPLIAEQADHVVVVQRTPNYSIPARNASLDPTVVAARKAVYPAHRDRLRHSQIGVLDTIAPELATATPADERERRFRAGFERGTIYGVTFTFGDLLIDPTANGLAGEFVRDRIRERIGNTAVADALLPHSYPFATKRVCLDTGYFEVFDRPHVTLVDVRATPLVEVTPQGLRTTSEHHDVDAIVLATGFDAVTGPLLAIDPVGRGGVALHDVWDTGPRAYLGLATAGFPNLFMIAGPGSPSVISNMMVSIEQHVDWIADCIAAMGERGATVIEATAPAEDGWVAHVAEIANFTLFPRADSWYVGANVPGKPRVFLAYLGGVGRYREHCDGVAADGYRGFVLR